MNTLQNKVSHVRKASQSREHTCHWTGCNKQVPPAMWGCSFHWYKLPLKLRNKIWATYKVGQEETLTPSTAYLQAAKEVDDYIGGLPK